MNSVRAIATVVATTFMIASGSANILARPTPPASGAQTDAGAPVSPWLALAALSRQVETPERLCYWDFRDERWIPADSDRSAKLIKEDPRPVFREAGTGLNKCQGGVPAAAIGTIGAVLSAFVYIATEDKDGSFQRESISPS